ncbi:hypothetical protein B0H13DRAFT_2542761 [Mycena leptocephala]|nr:hypothetical protein B0H13DRAFT_2542761 [Mycena leptocephala]
MANRSIGIREINGSKTTTKKQLAPADSRVEILPKMAMIESKVAGRSGGIRGLSVKVRVRSMALSERCRERIAKPNPSGDSRKSRNGARCSHFTAETKGSGHLDHMPNPKRQIAGGDPLYVTLVDFFGDDISGNTVADKIILAVPHCACLLYTTGSSVAQLLDSAT